VSAHFPNKVFVVGRETPDALEGSYARAFRALGATVVHWDMPRKSAQHTRIGKVGKLLNNFWPVEAWLTKANRDLVLAVLEHGPDLVIVGGTNRVLAGALSQIKASLPECQLVLVWPDSLLNCYSHVIDAIPVYDLIATYSRSTVDPLTRLGARKVVWLPLAFDPDLHLSKESIDNRPTGNTDCDVSFVGNYTAEREEAVLQLASRGLRIKVWGPLDWQRFAKNRTALKSYWQGGPLFGADFSRAIKCAPVSLNPINPITFPAANMRFFEIMGIGGAQVSAACPEMEAEFSDNERCFYYGNGKFLGDVVERILGDDILRGRVAKAGQERILAAHTYVHRARAITELIA
jgi:hypothetical protein